MICKYCGTEMGSTSELRICMNKVCINFGVVKEVDIYPPAVSYYQLRNTVFKNLKKVLLISLIPIAIFLLIVLFNWRYASNFLFGPYELSVKDISQVHKLYNKDKIFVRVLGNGIHNVLFSIQTQEYKRDRLLLITKSRIVTSTDYFTTLKIGDQYLIVSTRNLDNHFVEGELKPLPDPLREQWKNNITYNILELEKLLGTPLNKSQEEEKTHILDKSYPLFIDGIKDFKVYGRWGIGITCLLFSLIFLGGIGEECASDLGLLYRMRKRLYSGAIGYIYVKCPKCEKVSRIKQSVTFQTDTGYTLNGTGKCSCGLVFDKIRKDDQILTIVENHR